MTTVDSHSPSSPPTDAPSSSTSGAGKWPVLDLSAADAADVCQLFERVFAHPMSASFHAWKYADGRGMATGMRDDQGQLVSHYGGTLRVMQWGTARFTGVQVGDVMVAAEVRDVFARFGPFGRVARQFIQQYLGTGRPYPIGFGFPNARHVLLGRRLGLYWPVTQVLAWHWSRAALENLAPPLPAHRPLDMNVAQDRATVDSLAAQMQADFNDAQMLCPLRGADWWRHRYTNHPHFRYQIHTVLSDDGVTPIGALVLKAAAGSDEGNWELMDWVGPPAFTAEVLHHAAALCLQAPTCTGLELWCTEAVSTRLPHTWTVQAQSSVACEVVVNDDHLLGLPIAPLKHSFWLTGGDTDFH